jgi:hypothetical protein
MTSQIDADIAAIAAATQHYLDGLYEGDAGLIESVFLPTSALTQSLDGEVKVTPRDEWLHAVRNRPAPRANGLSRHDQILTIDRINDNLALVKVKCAIPPRHFTDLLCFVKRGADWMVAQKVFTTETRA